MKAVSEAHVVVSGRVQGGFFRASTRDVAVRGGGGGVGRHPAGGRGRAGATLPKRTRGSMSVTDLPPAAHWRPEGGAVRCGLCPHRCLISEGKQGICGVRENRGGTLLALTYGKVSAVQGDPIEKKPLFHFHPGKPILSVGSVGCNFRCGFCQNYHLVEKRVPLYPVVVADLVRAARGGGAVGSSSTDQ